jgi:protein-disulfide isomerase
MFNQYKTLIIGAVVTIGLLIGGIVLMSRPPKPVNNQNLLRSTSHRTVESAPVTLVEFGDFQCPACGSYHPVLKQLLAEFGSDLQLVFRNFPLTNAHANAYLAAQAAEAASLQNKYWEMHDLLYEKQTEWDNSSTAQAVFEKYAQDLKLDVAKFKADLSSTQVTETVNQDMRDGQDLSVNSTPTFYLNGEKIANPGSYTDFQTLVKAALLKTKSSSNSSPIKFHAHADLNVYQNGRVVDFSQDKYQSTEEHKLDENVHLHDGNGTVVHLHQQHITLGQFFTSINFTPSRSSKLYVNDKIVEQAIVDYAPADLDRILITDSTNQSTITQQLKTVTDLACIYSEKCPERGKPPTEGCVGGLGTGCAD